MVGIPDGLGAFDNGDGTLTVLMNHELGSTAGSVRAHGAAGAFVSRWVIDAGTLAVEAGEDLVEEVVTWNPATGTWNAAATGVALGRLCSADLPARTAFYNPKSQHGYDGRIFMDGEEVTGGRAFATSWTAPATSCRGSASPAGRTRSPTRIPATGPS